MYLYQIIYYNKFNVHVKKLSVSAMYQMMNFKQLSVQIILLKIIFFPGFGGFGVLSCQFWSIVLQSGARLPIHTLNYLTEQSVVPGF